LKDLIPIDINRLVLETGYFEVQIGGTLLSLAPERHPNGRYYVALFRNHLRQHQAWELSAMPHCGRLQQGGYIPYRCDERYFVVGADGHRYGHLFIDPENMTIGVRTDFFPKVNDAYPRGKAKEENKTFREQVQEMGRELFGEKDEFLCGYKKLQKKSLGI
jgi:hypothetical protein